MPYPSYLYGNLPKKIEEQKEETKKKVAESLDYTIGEFQMNMAPRKKKEAAQQPTDQAPAEQTQQYVGLDIKSETDLMRNKAAASTFQDQAKQDLLRYYGRMAANAASMIPNPAAGSLGLVTNYMDLVRSGVEGYERFGGAVRRGFTPETVQRGFQGDVARAKGGLRALGMVSQTAYDVATGRPVRDESRVRAALAVQESTGIIADVSGQFIGAKIALVDVPKYSMQGAGIIAPAVRSGAAAAKQGLKDAFTSTKEGWRTDIKSRTYESPGEPASYEMYHNPKAGYSSLRVTHGGKTAVSEAHTYKTQTDYFDPAKPFKMLGKSRAQATLPSVSAVTDVLERTKGTLDRWSDPFAGERFPRTAQELGTSSAEGISRSSQAQALGLALVKPGTRQNALATVRISTGTGVISRSGTGTQTGEETTTKTTTETRQGTLERTSQASYSAARAAAGLATAPKLTTVSRLEQPIIEQPRETQRTRTPGLGVFVLPGRGLGGIIGKRRASPGLYPGRKTRYAPSLGGLLSGRTIRSEPKKKFYGFETRYPVKKGKKQKSIFGSVLSGKARGKSIFSGVFGKRIKRKPKL